jgi:hypothetical protein
MQIGDLFYVKIDANTWGSREEKLGYAVVDEIDSDLKMTLEKCRVGEVCLRMNILILKNTDKT